MSARGLAFEAARDLDHVSQLAEALERPLAPPALLQLGAFAELVARWNARIDLTAARSAEQLSEVMFADALLLADEALVPRGARVLDVGSGAGAPAIPLALLRPDVTLVLIEPLHKRVAFLRTAVGSLDGLAGRVEVREGKIDPRASSGGAHSGTAGAAASRGVAGGAAASRGVAGAPFDVAMARATFAPAVWLPLALSLASCALVLTAAEEPPTAPAGARRVHAVHYALPRTDAPRAITAYRAA